MMTDNTSKHPLQRLARASRSWVFGVLYVGLWAFMFGGLGYEAYVTHVRHAACVQACGSLVLHCDEVTRHHAIAYCAVTPDRAELKQVDVP